MLPIVRINVYEIPHKKCRLRPKYSTKNKPKINDEEQEYLTWFKQQDFPCFVCGTMCWIEGHHIKENSTDAKEHTSILGLCHKHHHGQELSPHGTPKKFRQKFPVAVQRVQAKQYYKMFLDR